MNTETAAGEIVTIQKRLTELDEERALWGDDPFVGKMDLLDEERELRARLAELQGSQVTPKATAAR